MKLEQAILHMTEIMLKDMGMQKIADEASKILERPLWLTDLNYHFLTNPGAIYPVKEKLMEGYRFGMIGRESLVYLHHKKIMGIVNRRDRPYVYFDESLGTTLAVTAVRIKDVVVAHLVICETDSPIGDFDISFLIRLKDIISLELQRSSSASLESKSATSLILSEMLDRQCSTMEQIYNFLEAIKYPLSKDFRLVIVYRPVEKQNTFPWSAVLKQMDPLFQRSIYTDHCGCLVILISQSNDITDYQIEQFSKLLRHSDLKAGISYQFHDLEKLYQVYCEVRELIFVRERVNSAEHLHRYEDCIVDLAAARLADKLDIHSIAGDAITKVIAYDQKYGQEALPTLKAYVGCSFNIKHTAKKLHIHENTMRYRAKRLEEIMGIDLDNSGNIFELVLALKILELKRDRWNETEDHNQTE